MGSDRAYQVHNIQGEIPGDRRLHRAAKERRNTEGRTPEQANEDHSRGEASTEDGIHQDVPYNNNNIVGSYPNYLESLLPELPGALPFRLQKGY